MSCSNGVGYQHFRGPCFPHLQDEVSGPGSGQNHSTWSTGGGPQRPIWANRKEVRMIPLVGPLGDIKGRSVQV